jgi:hypothetical protein
MDPPSAQPAHGSASAATPKRFPTLKRSKINHVVDPLTNTKNGKFTMKTEFPGIIMEKTQGDRTEFYPTWGNSILGWK